MENKAGSSGKYALFHKKFLSSLSPWRRYHDLLALLDMFIHTQ